jgi:hypothetical protein
LTGKVKIITFLAKYFDLVILPHGIYFKKTMRMKGREPG